MFLAVSLDVRKMERLKIVNITGSSENDFVQKFNLQIKLHRFIDNVQKLGWKE